MADFKLKKNTQKDADKALFKKHKRLVKEYEERKADIKKEVTEQEDVIVLKNTNALKPERNKDQLLKCSSSAGESFKNFSITIKYCFSTQKARRDRRRDP